MESEHFERFSVYKFSMDYPDVCRVEFNPRSRREGGDIVFHFPDREKIFLSWGALEKAQKKFPTAEEQAEHSVKSVQKSGNIKNVERAAHDALELNSHKAVYNHIKMDEIPAGFFPGRKAIKRQVHSVHIQCEQTQRYFVIYSLLSPNAPEDFGDLLKTMVNSFKCH